MKTAAPPRASEVDKVFAMRMLRLLKAGYTEEQAEELAGRFDIDLHEAESLIRQSKLAFRILI